MPYLPPRHQKSLWSTRVIAIAYDSFRDQVYFVGSGMEFIIPSQEHAQAFKAAMLGGNGLKKFFSLAIREHGNLEDSMMTFYGLVVEHQMSPEQKSFSLHEIVIPKWYTNQSSRLTQIIIMLSGICVFCWLFGELLKVFETDDLRGMLGGFYLRNGTESAQCVKCSELSGTSFIRAVAFRSVQ